MDCATACHNFIGLLDVDGNSSNSSGGSLSGLDNPEVIMPRNPKMNRLQRMSSSDGCMRRVRRASIDESYEVGPEVPIPPVAEGGARIRVCYVGACYTENELSGSRKRRPRLPGIHDTSLYPAIEISGIIDDLCNTVANSSNNNLEIGDHVVIYADESEDLSTAGYAEFITVKNAQNLVKVPCVVPLEVAAILPGGALTAYSTVSRALSFIEGKAGKCTDSHMNMLIVGAGGLGLWTVTIAKFLLASYGDTIRIIVADHSVDKLDLAKQHGSHDAVHWNEQIYEEHILDRTRNACQGGIEVIIDYVSSSRTMSRGLQLLNEGGVMVAGGNSKQEVTICLSTLTRKHQCVIGVPKASRDQLHTLIDSVAQGGIVPPCYYVYPLEEANIVFRRLSQCEIKGRAVLCISESEEENSSDKGVSSPCSPEEGPVFT